MPITLPKIDDRRYEDLVQETLARIPVHTPEWTNFNQSDPGVTLIELFAFLTETLLYRSNLIPERNRKKFLQLLKVPLNTTKSARGITCFSNAKGPQQVVTLSKNTEVFAGALPYRTDMGLDVLPIEGKLFFKKEVKDPQNNLLDYYSQLYASYRGQPPVKQIRLYESTPFPLPGGKSLPIASESIDGSLWLALLVRQVDMVGVSDPNEIIKKYRSIIANRVLNIGFIPEIQNDTRIIYPHKSSTPTEELALEFSVPNAPPEGVLPENAEHRKASFRRIDSIAEIDIFDEPGVIQVLLPDEKFLETWVNLDPLESGAGDFPPSIDDSNIEKRIITWIKIRFPQGVGTKICWAGINSAMISQRKRITNETLLNSDGEPDQVINLANKPVIADSMRLRVKNQKDSRAERWFRVDDLAGAPGETNKGQAASTENASSHSANVYVVDEEAGQIHFGDGMRGARPAKGSSIIIDYDVSAGIAGNVGTDSINSGPDLPPGISVSNPVPTWGGADAEEVSQAEKLIPHYLQHRDRLVTVRDYETIVKRTPGLAIARVEIIAAYNPEMDEGVPGDAPGAITVMVIPKNDPRSPDSPMPDSLFLNSICKYIEPRRLVTTEVYLRGPKYKDIWVSIGITVKPGESVAEVRELVKKRIRQFISPIAINTENTERDGWPLGTPVVALEIVAEASRELAVQRVNGVQLSSGNENELPMVAMSGLELPRLRGIDVSLGEPLDVATLMNGVNGGGSSSGDVPGEFVPVPIVPGEC